MDPGALWSSSDYAPTARRLQPVAEVISQSLADRIEPPAAVLEVGAGHGQLAALLANRGYNVAAVEPSSRMREIGVRQTPASVRWVDARAESIALEPASFDAAVSSFGLMFADPSAGVREVARLLRPGGALIMTAWAPSGFLHEMMERMLSILPQLATAPHLAWGEPSVARGRLREYFHEITVEQKSLPWQFSSAGEGMDLYRSGSPTHAASFTMAGERRTDLERELERHLHEHAAPDGTIKASANYLFILATRQ